MRLTKAQVLWASMRIRAGAGPHSGKAVPDPDELA